MLSSIVRALVASGATPEMIAAAVEAAEADANSKAQARLEKGRERSRRYRERHAEERDVTLGDVTQHDDTSPTVTNVTVPETRNVSPKPPSKETQPLKETPLRGAKKRGVRISDDFAPDLSAAQDEGLSRQQAEREARKFVDYWRGVSGEKGVKLDWPATWRNWARRAAEHFGVEGRAAADGSMVSKSDSRWQFLTARWERENGQTFPKLADKWPFPAAWLIDANKPDWPELPAFMARTA